MTEQFRLYRPADLQDSYPVDRQRRTESESVLESNDPQEILQKINDLQENDLRVIDYRFRLIKSIAPHYECRVFTVHEFKEIFTNVYSQNYDWGNSVHYTINPTKRKQAADLPTSGVPTVQTLRSWGSYIGQPWTFGNRLWCGLYACMWLKLHGYSCPGYHVSTFFAKFPATKIRPGVVAVNNRHVGIVAQVNNNGTFTMLSGNTTGRAIAYNTRRVQDFSYREPR